MPTNATLDELAKKMDQSYVRIKKGAEDPVGYRMAYRRRRQAQLWVEDFEECGIDALNLAVEGLDLANTPEYAERYAVLIAKMLKKDLNKTRAELGDQNIAAKKRGCLRLLAIFRRWASSPQLSGAGEEGFEGFRSLLKSLSLALGMAIVQSGSLDQAMELVEGGLSNSPKASRRKQPELQFEWDEIRWRSSHAIAASSLLLVLDSQMDYHADCVFSEEPLFTDRQVTALLVSVSGLMNRLGESASNRGKHLGFVFNLAEAYARFAQNQARRMGQGSANNTFLDDRAKDFVQSKLIGIVIEAIGSGGHDFHLQRAGIHCFVTVLSCFPYQYGQNTCGLGSKNVGSESLFDALMQPNGASILSLGRRMTTAMKRDDSATIELCARAVCASGEWAVDGILAHVLGRGKEEDLEPTTKHLLSLLLLISRYPANDDISTLGLNFWYMLQERVLMTPIPSQHSAAWGSLQACYRENLVSILGTMRLPPVPESFFAEEAARPYCIDNKNGPGSMKNALSALEDDPKERAVLRDALRDAITDCIKIIGTEEVVLAISNAYLTQSHDGDIANLVIDPLDLESFFTAFSYVLRNIRKSTGRRQSNAPHVADLNTVNKEDTTTYVVGIIRHFLPLLQLISTTIKVPWVDVAESPCRGANSTRNRNFFNNVKMETIRPRVLSLELTRRGQLEQETLNGCLNPGEASSTPQFTPRHWNHHVEEQQLIISGLRFAEEVALILENLPPEHDDFGDPGIIGALLAFLRRNIPPLIHPGGKLEVVSIAGDALGSIGRVIASTIAHPRIGEEQRRVDEYVEMWLGDSGDAMRARGPVNAQIAFIDSFVTIASRCRLSKRVKILEAALEFEAEYLRRAAELELAGQASVEAFQSLRRINWIFKRILREHSEDTVLLGCGVSWYLNWLTYNSVGCLNPPIRRDIDESKIHPNMRTTLSQLPELLKSRLSDYRKGLMWLGIHSENFRFEFHECLQNGLRLIHLYNCNLKVTSPSEETVLFTQMLLKIGTESLRVFLKHPSLVDLRTCGASPNACRTLSLALSLFNIGEDWDEVTNHLSRKYTKLPVFFPSCVDNDNPKRKLQCLLRDTMVDTISLIGPSFIWVDSAKVDPNSMEHEVCREYFRLAKKFIRLNPLSSIRTGIFEGLVGGGIEALDGREDPDTQKAIFECWSEMFEVSRACSELKTLEADNRTAMIGDELVTNLEHGLGPVMMISVIRHCCCNQKVVRDDVVSCGAFVLARLLILLKAHRPADWRAIFCEWVEIAISETDRSHIHDHVMKTRKRVAEFLHIVANLDKGTPWTNCYRSCDSPRNEVIEMCAAGHLKQLLSETGVLERLATQKYPKDSSL